MNNKNLFLDYICSVKYTMERIYNPAFFNFFVQIAIKNFDKYNKSLKGNLFIVTQELITDTLAADLKMSHKLN